MRQLLPVPPLQSGEHVVDIKREKGAEEHLIEHAARDAIQRLIVAGATQQAR